MTSANTIAICFWLSALIIAFPASLDGAPLVTLAPGAIYDSDTAAMDAALGISGLIPTSDNRYPFHGIKPAIGQARCAARCQASGKCRNAPDGRFDATGGRVLLPEGSVALRLKCRHYGAKRSLPSGKIIPTKWVSIIARRYQ